MTKPMIDARIDAAIAAYVYQLITIGGCEESELLGTDLSDLRLRIGNEGPGAYTSLACVSIEQRHIDAAVKMREMV